MAERENTKPGIGKVTAKRPHPHGGRSDCNRGEGIGGCPMHVLSGMHLFASAAMRRPILVLLAVVIGAILLHRHAHRAIAADEAKPESHTFDAKGVKLHYLTLGAGEPVILIHGLHSSAEMNWVKPGVFAALAKDRRVIAIDMPGHGQSDKPEDERAYGEQMAEDIALLMDELKIEKAHVVGYSMGGMVTLKFVAKHQDRVLSATLGGMGWLRDGSRLQKFWEELPQRENARTPSACAKSFGKLALSEDELKAIQVPVEVIVGDRDPVRKLYVDPLRAARKDWPVVEVDGAGHLNCIIKPQFKEAITQWIAKNTKA